MDANEFSITISTLFKTPTGAPAAADWQNASKTKLKLKPVSQNSSLLFANRGSISDKLLVAFLIARWRYY